MINKIIMSRRFL